MPVWSSMKVPEKELNLETDIVTERFPEKKEMWIWRARNEAARDEVHAARASRDFDLERIIKEDEASEKNRVAKRIEEQRLEIEKKVRVEMEEKIKSELLSQRQEEIDKIVSQRIEELNKEKKISMGDTLSERDNLMGHEVPKVKRGRPRKVVEE